MRPRDWFAGLPTVAKQEFLTNMKSVRLLIMVAILALLVVGSAYGLSGSSSFGTTIDPIVVWVHPSSDSGDNVAVAWVSDPYGRPSAGLPVTFYEPIDQNREENLGTITSDGNGFARLNVGNRTFVRVQAELGAFRTSGVLGFGIPRNFSYQAVQNYDLNDDNVMNDLAIHVMTAAGQPASARIYVNGTFAMATNANGYALVTLHRDAQDVTVEVGADQLNFEVIVQELPASPFGSPDGALFLVAAGFLYLVAPIFAIVITFDAVTKERVQGTLDLLLSRPVSRTGVLLGKFLGAFGAVAVPLTGVNLVGLGVITATSGEMPSGGFAAAFVGLTLLLIAFYVLIQIIFSTLAKTSGTAVLFGVLVWLLFNILYGIVVLVIGFALPSPEARFTLGQVATLGNPSAIYQALIILAAPEGLAGFFGGSSLTVGALGAAAAVWFVILFALAFWTFNRKATE